MLLNKEVQILVFELDDDGTFENIGEISKFNNLMWPSKYSGHSEFELWVPINDENMELLKEGNVIWCRDDDAAIVEISKSQIDDAGVMSLNVKGRTLESLLTRRIVWDTYSSYDYVSNIMYDLVELNCVNPVDEKRKIPFLKIENREVLGKKINYQKTGGEVYDAVDSLAKANDLGFSIRFDPRQKSLIFEVYEGKDRTINQSENDPIEFSTDLEDILKSSYYRNSQDEKVVALVAAEGEGAVRKREISGDGESFGFARKELYVDARDIQSEITNSDGTSSVIPESEFKEMIIQRGNEKLADRKVTENFEATIRVFGDVQYEYGVDFFKGDKVTVRDNQLKVLVSARISEAEQIFSNTYSLSLTFGYGYPTMGQKFKSAIN